MMFRNLAIFTIFGVLSIAAHADNSIDCTNDGALTSEQSIVIDQGLSATCHAECQKYWADNPTSRPAKGEAPYCNSAKDFAKNLGRHFSASCIKGLADGFSFLEQLRAYALLGKNVGDVLREQIKERGEFFENAKNDPKFRLQTFRFLARYSQRDENGKYLIPDEKVISDNSTFDLVALSAQISQEQSSRERSCSVRLAQLAAKWGASGLDGNALATLRYQTVAKDSPECVGTLHLAAPENANGAPDFAPNGMKFQCYTPERLEELTCKQAAKMASDPANVVAVGAVAGKVIAKGADLIPKGGLLSSAADAGESSLGGPSLSASASSHPAVAAHFENLERGVNFGKQFKSVENLPLAADAGALLDPTTAEGLAGKVKSASPEVRNSILSVYNRMHNSKAFGKYLKKLTTDVVADMQARKIPGELDDLASGNLNRTAVLRVLVRRAKLRGDGNFSTLTKFKFRDDPINPTKKPNTPEGTREAIAQGPFFDKAVGVMRNKIDLNLLQRDYVSDVVEASTNGKPATFYNYLGSEEGNSVYVPLFSAPSGRDTFGSPAFLQRAIDGVLPLK